MNRGLLNILVVFVAIMTVCIMGFWCYADAATYYVRTDGNNNCNGTTDAGGSSGNCAFRTILKGLQTAQAGDTVTVHSGSYTGETLASQRSGTSSGLITLQAYAGETVSISRMTISHNYNVINGFKLVSPGYPVASAALVLSGSYNQALNNTFTATCNPRVNGEGVCIGLSVTGSYNTASYNVFDGQNNGSSTAFGIVVYLEHTSSYNTISNNTIKDINSPGRVFEIYGSYNTISHNEVKNCQANVSSVDHPDVFQTFGTTVAHDITINGNYIHDFDGQLGNLGVDGNYASWTNWVFRNNIFANVGHPLFIYIPVAFYNNTFYNVATGLGPVDILSCSYAGSHGVGITAYNNAFVNCGDNTTGYYNADRYGVVAADYNYVGTASYGSKSGFNETHGVNGGNPQFTAAYTDCMTNVCDFHISRPTSVVNGRGANLSLLFTTDYDGNTRLVPWDIGVYEYVSGPPPSTYTLTVVKSGTGSGTVAGTGIDCGSDCTETINTGASITLTASPDSGSVFSGWSGGGCSGTSTCTVTMNSDTTVTVNFNQSETPSGPIEAETGTIVSPMQIVSDAQASNGQYIQTTTTDSGTAAYTFNTPTTGIYKMVGRVYAASAVEDSLFFKIDSQAEDIWDFNPPESSEGYNVWREDEMTKRGIGTVNNPQYDPYTLELSQGNHTITFRGREMYAKLDYFQFVQVSDTTPPAAPTGLTAN